MNLANFKSGQPISQRGAVLFISLIMLLVMTLLGVAGLQGTTIEEKMAGNLLDNIHAFEAAEAALREGESQLAGTGAPPVVSSFSWLHTAKEIGTGTGKGTSVYADTSNLTSGANSADYGNDLQGGLARRPRYLVEVLPPVTDKSEASSDFNDQSSEASFYRITAYGEGKTDKAVAIVQSIYQR